MSGRTGKRMLVASIILGLLVLVTGAYKTVLATQGDNHKVVVCKYVGTPGDGERLQTGNNPIVVSVNALEGKGFSGTFPFAFSDAQGRSIAIRYAVNSHDGNISECPGGPRPTQEVTPSAPPASDSPAPSASVTPTEAPSVAPSASTQPSSLPSPVASSGAPTQPAPTLPATDTESGPVSPVSSSPITFGLFLIALIIGIALMTTRRSR